MADGLTGSRVFSSPLGSKPFGFSRLAYRAVSLTAIESIVGMAVRAMSLLRVEIPLGCTIFKRIFSNCHALEVLGVNARRVPASVVDNHPLGDITVCHKVSNSVCAAILLPKEERSIPILVKGAGPCMTGSTDFFNLCLKPIKFFAGQIHDNILCYTQGISGSQGCGNAVG